MKNSYHQNRQSEAGNVLFLILIAVALFAALSYAVTQSTRSGGGSADREKSILSGASLTQYPSALRTSLIRMLLNGVAVEELNFAAPTNFSSVSATDEQLVFHPNGGAAVFQQGSPDVMIGTAPGTWYFNAHWDIPDIGLSDDGAGDSGEIIAFLPNITSAVCRSINSQVGIDATGCTATGASDVPDLDSSTDETNIKLTITDIAPGYTFPATNPDDIQNATCTAFSGQPTGCFYDSDSGEYVFYSAILER